MWYGNSISDTQSSKVDKSKQNKHKQLKGGGGGILWCLSAEAPLVSETTVEVRFLLVNWRFKYLFASIRFNGKDYS